MKKKIGLTLGSIGTSIVAVTTLVSCGSSTEKYNFPTTLEFKSDTSIINRDVISALLSPAGDPNKFNDTYKAGKIPSNWSLKDIVWPTSDVSFDISALEYLKFENDVVNVPSNVDITLDTTYRNNWLKTGQSIVKTDKDDQKTLIKGSTIIPTDVAIVGNNALAGSVLPANFSVPTSVTKILSTAFYSTQFLESLKVSAHVKDVSDNAFQDSILTEGKSVIWDNKLMRWTNTAQPLPTGIVKISGSSFQGLTVNANFSLPTTVTTIDDDAFKGATIGDNLVIPKEVSLIIGSAFLESKVADGKTVTWAADEDRAEQLVRASSPSQTFASTIETYGVAAFAGYTIPNSFSFPTNILSISQLAFYGATFEDNFIVPNSVLDVDPRAFLNLTLPSKKVVTWNQVNSAIVTKSLLRGIDFIPTDTELKIIGSNSFDGTFLPDTFTVPNNIEEIYEYAFNGATFNGDLNIPSSVGIEEEVFSNVTIADEKSILQGTTLLKGSTLIPATVTIIAENAFWKKTLSSSFTIPNTVTTIKEWAFRENTITYKIEFPATVTSLHGAAFSDNILSNNAYVSLATQSGKRLVLGSNFIPDDITEIDTFAFRDTLLPEDFAIPSSVINISGNAFAGTTFSNDLIIPSNVTSIGSSAFGGVTLPDGRSIIWNKADGQKILYKGTTFIPDGITIIETSAFSEATLNADLSIPSTLVTIGTYAFYKATFAASLLLPPTVKSVDSTAFESVILPPGDTIKWDKGGGVIVQLAPPTTTPPPSASPLL